MTAIRVLMDQIAFNEQRKYIALWKECSGYRNLSPADYLTPCFIAFFKKQLNKGEGVIDFGCGPGRSAVPLRAAGLRVHLIDFCDNCLDAEIFLQTVGPNPPISFFQECLWGLPNSIKPAEWIICFDVLEHIPEEKVDSVLEAIASRMQKGGLFSICLRHDLCGVIIGEVLHLTVKPAAWWRKKINRYFSISHEFDLAKEYLVVALSPKHSKKKGKVR